MDPVYPFYGQGSNHSMVAFRVPRRLQVGEGH